MLERRTSAAVASSRVQARVVFSLRAGAGTLAERLVLALASAFLMQPLSLILDVRDTFPVCASIILTAFRRLLPWIMFSGAVGSPIIRAEGTGE